MLAFAGALFTFPIHGETNDHYLTTQMANIEYLRQSINLLISCLNPHDMGVFTLPFLIFSISSIIFMHKGSCPFNAPFIPPKSSQILPK